MKKIIRQIVSLTFLTFSLWQSVWAQFTENEVNTPGGIAVINLNHSTKPEAFYENKQVMVIGNPGNWQAIIGLPLNSDIGTHELKVGNTTKTESYQFLVSKKQYAEQYITLANNEMVSPSPANLERIQSESIIINKAKGAWSESDKVSLVFDLPVPGNITSPFGLRRFFNKQPRNPHTGIDLSASEGTPIQTAAPGHVINTGEYFFNGKTVFIEHGQGLITMYCHMSKIIVIQGQRVSRGETIGHVGSTGRVTAPHLHWGVIMNTVSIDPSIFIKE